MARATFSTLELCPRRGANTPWNWVDFEANAGAVRQSQRLKEAGATRNMSFLSR